MITGRENLMQIVEISDKLSPIFDKHGLGNYLNPDTLSKIGRFTRLKTLLESNNIDSKSFVERLNKEIEDKPVTYRTVQEDLHFSAMLPCGLRNPFKEFTESYLYNNGQKYKSLNYLIEGNVNHELSYYPLLDSIIDSGELPGIIMASDVNNFFHRPFVERFIKNGLFEAYRPYQPNNYLQKSGFADPANNFTMYTANMLVMVVDKKKLGNRPMPQKWEDILDDTFHNEIIMRGEDNFFCNAVMLPFFKDNGFDAIRILAKNIKSGMHPAEMVKLAGKNNEKGATIYIMPWFFSKRIKSKNIEIVWPSDGAIASPVFLLVKKGMQEKQGELLEFIFAKETANMLYSRFFPVIHPEMKHHDFPEAVNWLGWDFLNNYDIGKLKEDIRIEFMKVWNNKTK